ncbi:MAG: hypothetical protein IJ849_08605 [Selenomonadaceae bacterium]|nr:hypothetical protein [Selenomonadaceae bacterium]
MSNIVSMATNSNLINSMFSTRNTGKQNSVTSLWNNYSATNGFTSASGMSAANLYGVKESYAELVSSYNTAKDSFYADLDSDMADLKDAAAAIKNTNFNVGENAVTTTTSVNDEGETVTTKKYNENLQNALDAVNKLVDSYNSTNTLLSDSAELSPRLKNAAKMFSDTTARADLYESIGISVGSGGKLTVDEDKLVSAITDDPNRVTRILGEGGLADKAESHVSRLESQQGQLFPTLSSMYGSQVKAAEAYTGSAAASMLGYANVGNLMNMFF